MTNPKRDFIFIDEHGDPGPIGAGSDRFATCAVHVTDASLERLVECFADMRFYRQTYGEIKRLHHDARLRPKLAEILMHMSEAHDVGFSVTFLDKRRYTGPYLGPGEGTHFRNFQVRRLLEWHLSQHPLRTSVCEIVFDRHGHSLAQLADFARYLNKNWNLPPFAHVTGVDSLYVESIQVADLALSLYRKKELEQDPDYRSLNLAFMAVRDVTEMSRGWKP